MWIALEKVIRTHKNNKLILKIQQRFNEDIKFFNEEIKNIALSSIDDKRIQSINSIEIYAYWMSKDLVCKKE